MFGSKQGDCFIDCNHAHLSIVIALVVGGIFHVVGVVTEELALWQRAPTKDHVPDEGATNAVFAARACAEVTGTPRYAACKGFISWFSVGKNRCDLEIRVP